MFKAFDAMCSKLPFNVSILAKVAKILILICTEKGMIIRTINTLWVDHAHVKSRVADPDPYLEKRSDPDHGPHPLYRCRKQGCGFGFFSKMFSGPDLIGIDKL